MEEQRSRAQLNEPYTMIPNRVLRSERLDPFDKIILSLIISCNPSFPTYQTLRRWSGMSKERVWKSLRKLEEMNLVWRFKRGRAVEYVHFWDPRTETARKGERLKFETLEPEPPNGSPGEPDGSSELSTTQGPNGSPDEPIDPGTVRQTNPNGSPDELAARRTVRQANTKKTQSLKKEQRKIARARAGDLDLSKAKTLSKAKARHWIRQPWWEIREGLFDFLNEAEPRAG